MSIRAYVLLDITNGDSEYAVQMLRSKAGVVLADLLEGRPDIIAMVEAPDRRRLAEAIMPVIGCIDSITEDLHLLVTRDNEPPPDLSTHANSKPTRKLMKNAITGKKESVRRQPVQKEDTA